MPLSLATFRFLERPACKARFERQIADIRDHALAVLPIRDAWLIGTAAADGGQRYRFPAASETDATLTRGDCEGADMVGALLEEAVLDDCGQKLGAIVVTSHGEWESADSKVLRLIAKAAATVIASCQFEHDLGACLDRQEDSQQSAKDTEEKFSALAGHVPGAIFRLVRSASGQEQIVHMSPGCAGIWGYTSTEMESQPSRWWDSVLPEDIEAMRASLQRSQDNLGAWQHRWRVRHQMGFLRWLQAYGTPSAKDDGGVAWDILVLDVTVEQEAQLALAENTRLLHEAQKLESIGRLAGGIAHDFNNLLAVIIGNAEVIGAHGLGAFQEDSLREIVEASQRGATLVKQLLSFARKSDLRATVADVREVLVSVDSMLRRVLPANISLEVVNRAGLWPVQIDRSMFESALLNIVINARDAMPDGGAITIETSNERIDHDYIIARDEDIKPGRYVMVAVTDTGGGIEEAALPFIFEPFYSTRGLGDGAGLGLAMVQGFVKQSRGIIRIYSEPDRGTSLKMYFPAHEQNTLSGPGNAETLPKLANISATVLLVEDEEGVRRIIEKTITSAGYKVLVAASGDEGAELYQKFHEDIDIIVTDVVMPGKIQGPQLVRLARKINHNVPALYMSGYPHEANVHGNGIRAGDISLMKPIRRTDLLTALEKLWSYR